MIRTVGDMMDNFLASERRLLDASPITHGPTIGDMYEQLTRDALAVSVPPEARLEVVAGFIRDRKGNLSGQQDCMLVTGPGEKVPRTNARIVECDDVVAVLEIKKTLHQKGILEAVTSLGSVLDLDWQPAWPFGDTLKNCFRRILQHPLPPSEEFVSEEMRALYNVLEHDAALPLRIAFGHHGFRSEKGLRDGVISMLSDHQQDRSFTPVRLPNLVVNQYVAMAKTTGHPWYLPRDPSTGSMYLLATTGNRSTATVLLDQIWCRLHARGLVEPYFFSPDRGQESWNPLVATRFIPGARWEYQVLTDIPRAASAALDMPLEPAEISENQMHAIVFISTMGSLDDRIFEGRTPSQQEMRRELLHLQELGLVGPRLDEPNVWEFLIPTIGFEMTPEGKLYAGENTAGQLTYVGLKRAGVTPDKVFWIRAKRPDDPDSAGD
ncbi:DUF6602 domain-containing protein [Archangium sp.]|jgi:hypothetical protein|uniref:DUF6602 domain-containing protein n=1 Tax=Archangium sp. TaxID=1872627 RepID=UPI002ED9C753